MAKYRQVHVSFWQDGFVQDLSPEERYFYIYLMTNTKTNQCGVYELPIKNIIYETGISEERIIELLGRFTDWDKILYSFETKEIIMLNWVKYNPINNDNLQKCVKKELENVKNSEFLEIFINGLAPYLQADYKPLIRGYQGASKTLPSKGVKNKEQRIKNKEQGVKNKEGENPLPPEPIIKNNYAENVKLTVLEYEQLVNVHGKTETDEMIQNLNNYKGSTGKKYKSDFYTIQNWFRREVRSIKPGQQKTSDIIQQMREGGAFDDEK